MITKTEGLILLEAVNWYEKYCVEIGQSFDAADAIYQISDGAYLELSDEEIEILVEKYN